jgi:uncharacterized protein YneF (UPF0154 family)
MNTLLGLLPIAIAGLVGVVVGFYYAKKERVETRSMRNRRVTDRQASHPQVSGTAH